jgi:DNA-binding MarR family transcriptional regulator
MSSPPDDLDFFLALTLASFKAQLLVQRAFKEADVEWANWGLLLHVAAHGRATPSQLVAETGISATTIRDQVQGLVDRGVLTREPNPLDARSYVLTLTAAGERDIELGLEASRRIRVTVEQRAGDVEPLRRSLLALGAAFDQLRLEAAEGERADRVQEILRRRAG